MCAPSGTAVASSTRAEDGRRLRPRRDRADADVLVAEALEPVVEGARAEDGGELDGKGLLVGLVLPLRELRALDELAQTPEELRLECRDGESTPVRRVVDAVAREPAGQHARHRLAAEPVRDQVVRPVRHRDHDVASRAGARALEEGGEHLRHGSERSRREVGDLDRRKAGRRVLEDAGPAEVVEVVAGSRSVLGDVAEARDRAVDRRGWNVVRADAEARCDAGPEPLQHDVGSRAERPRESRVGGEIADDGLASRA